MNALKSAAGYLTGQLRQIGLFIALIVIVIFFQVATNGITLAPINVSNIIVQNSYILILAIGMVMVIIAGHIDLSVGSVVAFSGAMAGVMITQWGLPWPVAALLCLVVGALVGAWQGFWIAYFGIPAFIVTLAGMLAFRGATQIVLQNQQISPFPEGFRSLGSGFLPSFGTTGYEPLTMILGIAAAAVMVISAFRGRITRRKYQLESEPFAWFIVKTAFGAALVIYVALLLASYNGTPIVLVVLGLLVVVYSVVMRSSVFGRHVYAIGGNALAAQLSGVKTKRVTFLLFVNMGVIAALAGVVFTGQLNLAAPGAGNGFELDAIAAVFIGGAAVTGGIGTVPGAIVGGLIIGILNNGMSILGVGTEFQSLIKGLVLLAAVAFDVFNKRRAASARK
ncbi:MULTISPECIES: multiple monosaccharide ABC transporter permease [unclassified Curtobacterium]|jgi:putative multiple sugar transport system permease protein|uniref:multiple monosaccharide ABC transporter permease n=1 Tax=unclassified Curtobacterium TaxID=257496 RepID=UPI00052A8567|nr:MULTISPECIES: multiple monosaccharide ABC transporter permease [unclassified Curtobacterium]AIV40678.1 sugar ABC transporter permease [Curtobacterium sp. MR_MD2014]MBP1302855.1 putative multiple sugar transport system permease protein [Curtobacterium sp. 1310]MCM3504217.1 sugar ABC transporter permease [Curtobacterium sp. ODYSSEY 48 V2]MCM3523097.1 sugar ABC transporter permease [Curtobacterium sp. P97]MDB6428176.1 sugar ABC transporter permease [Curtobacterium sp. 20TX0008]